MGRYKVLTLTRLLLWSAIAMLCISLGSHALAQNGNGKAVGKWTLTTCAINGKTVNNCTPGMVKQANRQAAAVTAGATLATYTPSLGPDYFGTYPSYANSPVPLGSIGSTVPLFGGSGYSATPTVSITDAYNPAATGATASGTVLNGVITDEISDLV